MHFIWGLLLALVILPCLLAGCLPRGQSADECRLYFDQGTISRTEHIIIDIDRSTHVDPANPNLYPVWSGGKNAPVVGTIAGSAEEKTEHTTQGIELAVTLDSGLTIVVALPMTQEGLSYRVGDRVRFLTDCLGTMWVWPDAEVVTIPP